MDGKLYAQSGYYYCYCCCYFCSLIWPFSSFQLNYWVSQDPKSTYKIINKEQFVVMKPIFHKSKGLKGGLPFWDVAF